MSGRKWECRILVADSREALEEKVITLWEERPVGFEEFGGYAVVQISGRAVEYHQVVIKMTMVDVVTGILNAQTGEVE